MSKKKHNIILQPQKGSQELFVSCPIKEIINEGNRGSGKSLGVIIKFLQYVGKGYGASWKGVILRPEAKPLEDIINKSKAFIPKIFPKAKFLASKDRMMWIFPEGELLYFRHGKTAEDFTEKFLGHEFTFIAFEELTTWANSDFYDQMKTCLRSSYAGIPKYIVSNTNPYGIGFQWVKKKFVDPDPIGGRIIKDEYGNESVRIHSSLAENTVLMESDPDYINSLRAIKNVARRKAWLFGSWEINAGGYFEEYWDYDTHVMPEFIVPKSWKIDRSMDWGTAKPFSIGWWAESDGTPITFENGQVLHTIQGSLYRIYEFYGCKKGEPDKGLRMTPEAVAKIIKTLDEAISLKHKNTVLPGVADSAIFSSDTGETVATKMQEHGITWLECVKGPGSRVNGWEVMSSMFESAIYGGEIKDPDLNEKYGLKGKPSPGLYICDNCADFIRTIPELQIDTKKINDIDTRQEDHIADEARYRCTAPKTYTFSGNYLT